MEEMYAKTPKKARKAYWLGVDESLQKLGVFYKKVL